MRQQANLGRLVRQRVETAMNGVTRTVMPVHKAVRFERDHDEHMDAAHTEMGTVYEHAFRAMYGGVHIDEVLPEMDTRRLPDIIDIPKRIVTEVKSTRVNSQCQLRESQIGLLRALQAARPNATIRLAIFRHGIDNIKTFDDKRRVLYSEVANRTTYGLMLPFDLVLRLYEANWDCDKRLVRRYIQRPSPLNDGAHLYETCTCIQVATPHRIFYEPAALIRGMGASPSDYTITRQWSPERLVVQGHAIKQFPIMVIKHRFYRDWAEEFAKSFYRLVELHYDRAEHGFHDVALPLGAETSDAHEPDLGGLERIIPAPRSGKRARVDDDVPF